MKSKKCRSNWSLTDVKCVRPIEKLMLVSKSGFDVDKSAEVWKCFAIIPQIGWSTVATNNVTVDLFRGEIKNMYTTAVYLWSSVFPTTRLTPLMFLQLTRIKRKRWRASDNSRKSEQTEAGARRQQLIDRPEFRLQPLEMTSPWPITAFSLRLLTQAASSGTKISVCFSC